MQQIMTQCFFAVKSKLDQRLGLFDLIGCDFMIDEDFKVSDPWIIKSQCLLVCVIKCISVCKLKGLAVGDEL